MNHDVLYLAADENDLLWASSDINISAVDDSEEYALQPPVRNFRPSTSQVKELGKFQARNINGKVYFGTSKGIYSFQAFGDRLKLMPDATFGARFADGSREAINLKENKSGHIWLTSEFRTGQLRKLQDKAYVWDTIPLSKMPRVDVWTIYTDAGGIVWLGTTEGIFRYNPHYSKDYKIQPQTVLRKVKLSGDSTVFFGSFANKGAISMKQSERFKFKLPHAVRSISFEYAATSFEAPGQHLYSYMLEGEDKKWSHWTSETKKEFTGLDEGHYTFKVKSKNIYGSVSPVSTFEFESLPPFYRTWWAYTFYVVLWGLIVWAIIRVKHQNLIESKKSLEKLVHERTAQLEAEKKKSDDLLLNILPVETAEELKVNGRTVALRYERVTVLFTDFKDFTQISEDLTPEELVAVIDFYFCAFDKIISKYNIEKIKTIGDAYMCAGGIPNPDANTPADVVKAGLEILAFVENLNPENQFKKHRFEIRIGIHTGPVVAGIVGTKKFAYDIWGDTVNTASRMESSCQEGKVNISGATYELVKDEFICSYRGKVDAKNKGEIDMYFVEAIVTQPEIIQV
ncbi:adenylate/guanylate cyclase domain-containing protein [Pontibacter toksunensis]|uniref:Adenylate/guanylate cyclase domain-containing protein n=1 Tax=Pontibacter toksunensis TaxID=1332631 RepID=A0ABW6BQ88_9BACT